MLSDLERYFLVLDRQGGEARRRASVQQVAVMLLDHCDAGATEHGYRQGVQAVQGY